MSSPYFGQRPGNDSSAFIQKGWKERVTVVLPNECQPALKVSLWQLCESNAPDLRVGTDYQ